MTIQELSIPMRKELRLDYHPPLINIVEGTIRERGFAGAAIMDGSTSSHAIVGNNKDGKQYFTVKFDQDPKLAEGESQTFQIIFYRKVV
ncbi:MAG TPA: hypothetical protein VJJ52_01460 [Candidatus Nanoarchaeia archaeon]|nr:hypothetical protein [Candidatus Nanoarchaeia archaeon]